MTGLPPAPSLRTSRTDRAPALLGRAVELSRIVAHGVTVLALVAAGAAGFAWIVWIVRRPPEGMNDWAARLVVLGIALVPSIVLALFLAGLRDLAALPRRLRELPPDLRTRVGDVRSRASTGRRVGLFGAVVGLARIVFDAREVLSPYAVISAVLRPALLVAALVAAVAAVLEVPAALLSALALLVS